MSIRDALILGVVQGLTEFLPISSTAHLYLVQELLRIRNDDLALSFDVVLHLGTVLALVLATWDRLTGIVSEAFRAVLRLRPRDPASRALVLPLVVGTVPGVLAGLFLLERFEDLRSLALIGIAMLAACAYFLLAEAGARRRARSERELTTVTAGDGLWVGVAQAAAGLMAGFSRSGFTISTGRLRGLSRDDAARFSFLLALPIILGAGAKALLDLHGTYAGAIAPAALAAGFLASAVVGYAAVRFLLRYLKTHTLTPFAIYLGLLGAALLVVSLVRGLPLVGRV
jgi:undecaprenyl-diphosphatase